MRRREFLRLGITAAPATVLAACGWDGGDRIKPALNRISLLNDWVGEHLLFSSTRLAREYPVGARSGAAFPAYFISDKMPVLAQPEAWSLEVAGAVRQPTRFTMAMLQSLPRVTYTVKHHCVEGWTAIATWTGAPLSSVAAMVQPADGARFVRFDSFDKDYYNGWDMASAMHPQTILAYAYNDQPLMPDHGAPVRLYSPIKLGYKLTKYLRSITFTERRPGGYWEDQGYPWFGGV
jgi:DMSO/TMAO reductase YedYZ molybdopterin-dependent catalytic subunit